MKIIADLHLHGRYSQATSKNLSIKNLETYSAYKGTNLLGTGDFTHPKWIEEIKNELTEDETGILKTKSGFNFVLSTEISLIYSQAGKGHRIHNIVLAPNLDVVRQITEYLLTKGRVDYDGRPIFKIPCMDFVENLRNISQDIEVIPAHCWTPWFSLFGSMSGFDSVKEAFGDQEKHIHAIETGLSSDPAMNWRLSQLDKYAIVSFSDAHSYWPWRIGREATVFELPKLTYKSLITALRTKEGLMETIEFYPEEGKYHYDGHRSCNICMHPGDSIKNRKLCPKCGKQMTIGVMHRVEELADRPEGFKPKGAKPFRNVVPLAELICAAANIKVASKKMWEVYSPLIKQFGNEFNLIFDAPEEDLTKYTDEKLKNLILLNRSGNIKMKPGYDGVYGEMILDKEGEKKQETQSYTPKVVQKWSVWRDDPG